MHTYYVHGIATWEFGRLLQRLNAKVGLTLDDLKHTLGQVQWQRSSSEKDAGRASASYLDGLFSDNKISEDDFRGAAHEIKSALPILEFVLEQMPFVQQALPKEFACFRLLNDIRREGHLILSDKNRPVHRLETLQSLHQKSTIEAYSENALRPKHHHRFHIPSQMKALGTRVSCEAMETKHQNLTKVIVNFARYTKDGQLAKHFLPRFMREQMNELLQNVCLEDHLLDPIHDGSEIRQFFSLANADELQVSRKAIVGGRKISHGDFMRLKDVSSPKALLVQSVLQADTIYLLVEHCSLERDLGSVASWWRATSRFSLVDENYIQEYVHFTWFHKQQDGLWLSLW